MATSTPTPAPSVSAPPAAVPPPPPLAGEQVELGAVLRNSVRVGRWVVRGSAKVLGDVEVERAEWNGLVAIRGRIIAGSVASKGTLEVGGSVTTTGALVSAGETTIAGTAQAGSFDGQGLVTIGASMTVPGTARWNGLLQVGGDLTAGATEFEGRFEVEGAVAVAELHGKLRGTSRAHSVRADRAIVLRRAGRFGGAGTLTVDQIEAQTVEVEGVRAQLVRGQSVVVGPGCEIVRVEGTVRSVHRSSTIGPVSRSPPPYGLSR